MGYETGMIVMFDIPSGSVQIAFRGKLTILPGPYKNHVDAIAAGESYCRGEGWVDAGVQQSLVMRSVAFSGRPWA